MLKKSVKYVRYILLFHFEVFKLFLIICFLLRKAILLISGDLIEPLLCWERLSMLFTRRYYLIVCICTLLILQNAIIVKHIMCSYLFGAVSF